MLLIFGIFFAWETRKVRIEALNDSKEIGICVYNVMIMSVVGIVIYRLLPLDQMNMSFGVISVSVFVCALTTLMLVFGPKVCVTLSCTQTFISNTAVTASSAFPLFGVGASIPTFPGPVFVLSLLLSPSCIFL